MSHASEQPYGARGALLFWRALRSLIWRAALLRAQPVLSAGEPKC
jgi:hypothetical protein